MYGRVVVVWYGMVGGRVPPYHPVGYGGTYHTRLFPAKTEAITEIDDTTETFSFPRLAFGRFANAAPVNRRDEMSHP
jgi:hypothetical protein